MSKERELLNRLVKSGVLGGYSFIAEVKELLTQPEQPEQEPVAWTYEYGDEGRKFFKFTELDLTNMCPSVCNVRALYEAPPKREPLSDDEIEAIYEENTSTVYAFARAIEKAHGIGVSTHE